MLTSVLRFRLLILLALAGLGATLGGRARDATAGDFVNFESSQVHPLAFSAERRQLYAVNTPEGRLAIFDVAGDGSLALAGDVPVGLDPVGLAVRAGTAEVWVVNHLSDTVSIVDVSRQALVATIQAGDEPTDVAFAGGRAFVSLSGKDDQVKVYDAGTRSEIAAISIFGEDPRALAVSPDGTEVYVVVLESGNRTATLHPFVVRDGLGLPPNDPPANPLLPTTINPLIVQYDLSTQRWEDEIGRDWSGFLDMELPDHDLFVIDAVASSPSVVRSIPSVGTTLFDVASHPISGKLYIPNTDARNLIRFTPNLQGHLVETRVSIADPGTGAVTHVDLNPHIDYGTTPGPPSEIALSLAQPGDGVFTADGTLYYLAAFGSGKVGVLDGVTGAVIDRIEVGGGPTGVALDEADGRLYALDRFSNTIAVVDTQTRTRIGVMGVAGPSRFDPSPTAVTAGRKFLYDARKSGHGDIACATCHVFGNFDGLAWDLGDPTGEMLLYTDAPWVTFTPDPPLRQGFHPMKGPMTTQTLRGLDGHAPYHWRGDRRDLQAFNANFVIVLGADSELSTDDMDAFVDFMNTITMAPNPYRTLADGLPASISVPDAAGGGLTTLGDPTVGEDIFSNEITSSSFIFKIPLTCADCHAFPDGTTDTLTGAPLDPHDSKIAHMRNLYEKLSFNPIRLTNGIFGLAGPNIGLRPQKGSLGILHHGAVSLTEFLGIFIPNDVDGQHDLAAFLRAFPTGMAPAVGRQVTVDESSKSDVALVATIATLLDQARLGKCDVVAKGVVGGISRGYLYDGQADAFVPDSTTEGTVGEGALRASLGAGDVLTYTGVPPGTGLRSGIDRDRDTWRDGDEVAARTDAADPSSVPIACTSGAPGGIDRVRLRIARMNRPEMSEWLSLKGRFALGAVPTPPIDPAANGFNLKVVDHAGDTVFHRSIPGGAASAAGQAGWTTSPTGRRWTFRDPIGAAAGGITRVTLTFRPFRDPGLLSFRVRGRRGGFAVDPADLPLGVAVLLGTAAQDAAGQCASASFDAQGSGDPSCRLSADGRSLSCR